MVADASKSTQSGVVSDPPSWFPAGVDAPFQRERSMTQLKLVSKKELKSVYGVPYTFVHIGRLERVGAFPKRIQLGQCRVA